MALDDVEVAGEPACEGTSRFSGGGQSMASCQQSPKGQRDQDAQLRDFSFPYVPYGIQVSFMRHLYRALSSAVVGSGRVAVMESPTGTGKSLSIICAALTWVREAKAQQSLQKQAVLMTSPRCEATEPDWVTGFNLDQLKHDNKLHHAHRRESKLHRRVARRLGRIGAPGEKPGDEFLLEGDGEPYGAAGAKHALPCNSSSSGSDNELSDDGGDSDEGESRPQILFCSRTHSQLAQFVREINRTTHRRAVHVVTLGSRQNFCLNDSVRKLGSVGLMNERCNDLRQQKISVNKALKTCHGKHGSAVQPSVKPKRACRCTYASPGSIALFKQACASSERVMDMEDLVSLGKQLHACPYYGTRTAAADADVVCLPYNMLFQGEARESLGVHLRGRVVIVDEAHNLHDAINGMCSVTVSGVQFETAMQQLQQYQRRYATRLRADNLQRINQTLRVLRSLASVLRRGNVRAAAAVAGCSVADHQQQQRLVVSSESIVSVNEFLFEAGLDNLNLFELLAFIQESKLAQKLNGFVQFAATEAALDQQRQGNVTTQQPRLGAMHTAVAFLKALTHANEDGRIVVTHAGSNRANGAAASAGAGGAAMPTASHADGGQLRFLMLNPAAVITPLLSELRALVLAGGTMVSVRWCPVVL